MAIRKSLCREVLPAGFMEGGEKGNVTGISKLTISNTAAITENIFGGSDSGTCGNTEVNVPVKLLRMAYMEVVLLGR